MLYVGDHVSHNSFPPLEGFIIGIEKSEVGGESKICVTYEGEKIFYDYEESWDLVSYQNDSEVDSVQTLDIEMKDMGMIEYSEVNN